MALPLMPIVLGLAQYAPTLMRYLGVGEANAQVASKVLAVAQAVTGTADPAQALAAIQQDSKAAAAFQQRVIEIDSELERDYLADRADARARDVALAKAGKRNLRADLMVLLDVIGLIACLVVLVLFKHEIPGEAVALVTTIASMFGLCLRDAHQFEFGSSRGSREKDSLMAAGRPGARD